MTRQFIILDSKSQVRYEFEADTWQDARDTFIGTAFEHQLELRKGYVPSVIVRAHMFSDRRHEIAFTADTSEIERWKLRERDGGFRGWVHNLIAAVS